MHRNKLIQMLNLYNPLYTEETIFKSMILEFIKHHEDCFNRSLQIGHITASALVLNKAKTHALLTHHFKLNRWFQLGGHCDGESDVMKVAIKEAQEESGINEIIPLSEQIFDIDIHLIPANKKENAHYHYDIRFLLASSNNDEVKINQESKELRWIDKNIKELPTDNPSVVRLFEKWKNQKII